MPYWQRKRRQSSLSALSGGHLSAGQKGGPPQESSLPAPDPDVQPPGLREASVRCLGCPLCGFLLEPPEPMRTHPSPPCRLQKGRHICWSSSSCSPTPGVWRGRGPGSGRGSGSGCRRGVSSFCRCRARSTEGVCTPCRHHDGF